MSMALLYNWDLSAIIRKEKEKNMKNANNHAQESQPIERKIWPYVEMQRKCKALSDKNYRYAITAPETVSIKTTLCSNITHDHMKAYRSVVMRATNNTVLMSGGVH